MYVNEQQKYKLIQNKSELGWLWCSEETETTALLCITAAKNPTDLIHPLILPPSIPRTD